MDGKDKIMMKTIQEEIEEAILKLLGKNCEVTGSSRTDAGVHAKGIVANLIQIVIYLQKDLERLLNIKLT